MAIMAKMLETIIKSPDGTMGRLRIILVTIGGVKIYHVGKIESCGPRGPKPERCSMKNSIYSDVIH